MMIMKNIIKRYLPAVAAFVASVLAPLRSFAADEVADVNILRDTFLSLIRMGANINDMYDNVVKVILGDCDTCSQIVADHVSNCWSCFLVEKIFDAIDTVSTGVYELTAGPSRMVLTVLLGLWLLYHLGKHLMSFSPQEPADFWTKMGKTLFKAMFAGALLTMPISYVSNLLISPIVVGAVEFNQVIIKSYAGLDETTETLSRKTELDKPLFYDAISKDQRNMWRLISETGQFTADIYSSFPLTLPLGINTHAAFGIVLRWLEEMDAYENLSAAPSFATMSGCSLSLAEPDMDEGRMLNTQIYNALGCLTEMIHKEVSFGMAFASAIICKSWHAASYFFFNGPDFVMLISGIMIWLTCLIILVVFVFKVLDALIRLGILASVLPFLIVAWVFPSSMNYAKQGFKMLVHVMMNFIVLAIVIALAILMLITAFELENENLRQMCMLNDIQGLRDAMDLSGSSFFFAFACCFFGVKVMNVVDKTASEYTEVEFGSQAGDKVGAMASYVTATTLQATATIMAISVKNSKSSSSSKKDVVPDTHNDTEPERTKPDIPNYQAKLMDDVLYNQSTGKFNSHNASLLNIAEDDFKRVKEMSDQMMIINDTSGRHSPEAQDAARERLDKLEGKLEYQKLKQRYYDRLSPEEQASFSKNVNKINEIRDAVPSAKDRLDYTKYARDQDMVTP